METGIMTAFYGADRVVYFDNKIVGSLDAIRTDLEDVFGTKCGEIRLIAFSNLKEELIKINAASNVHITHRNHHDNTLTITIKDFISHQFVYNATSGPDFLEIIIPFTYSESVVNEYQVEHDTETKEVTVTKI